MLREDDGEEATKSWSGEDFSSSPVCPSFFSTPGSDGDSAVVTLSLLIRGLNLIIVQSVL